MSFQRPARLVRAGLSVAVTEAATVWWLSKRPVGWTLSQHLANPTINCLSGPEEHLACAVAGMVTGTQQAVDRIRAAAARTPRRNANVRHDNGTDAR